MAEFPSTETGMAQLSSRMRQGYGAYPTIFVHADLPGLQAAHVEYMGKYQTAYCYGAYLLVTKLYLVTGLCLKSCALSDVATLR